MEVLFHEFLIGLSCLFIFILLCFVWFMLAADADLTLLCCEKFKGVKKFTDKVVWITGASSGIGEYLAYDFARQKAKLVLSGVNTERLDKVKCRCKEIAHCSDEAILVLPFLIENFQIHDDCVKKVLDYFGKIDILVNNAGLSQRADFKDIDIEVDQRLFNINVFGSVNLTRKVLSHFIEKNEGHIVVTSSLAGKLGAPFSSAYTGSKHALHGYFEGLRTEMVPKNINVTIVCPGPVFSAITDRCVTGKVGEIYDHTQKSTDKKMKTERCSKLMLTAIANKLDECWISMQPLLLLYYLSQYTPSFFKSTLLPIFFSEARVAALRQGR